MHWCKGHVQYANMTTMLAGGLSLMLAHIWQMHCSSAILSVNFSLQSSTQDKCSTGRWQQCLQVDFHLLDIKTGSEASAWLRPNLVLNVQRTVAENVEAGTWQHCLQPGLTEHT